MKCIYDIVRAWQLYTSVMLRHDPQSVAYMHATADLSHRSISAPQPIQYGNIVAHGELVLDSDEL
jgi:hypothetical protein